MLPKAGTRIGGYVLGDELGRGGAATVYLATDVKHDRSVALKLLNADTSSALGGDRFKREIDVVAKLQHPHILPLYDSGEVDGQLYYVMPLVTGETLCDRIGRDGLMALADVRRVVNDIAAALDYAHRRGVVHRDVKPANILIDDEHATIADFGIAHRALDDSTGRLTAAGLIIGTPTYMSPEQATGSQEVDARTDVYALGCVVFEMLTGVPPFRAQNASALVIKHLQSPVPSARELRPDLPPAVDQVLATALAKNSADRFASTRDFASAFGAALESTSAPAVAAPVPPRSAARWRTVPIAIIAAVVMATAAGIYAATREPEPPSIAVLPFANLSDSRENEYFSDGITEELTGALIQVGRFRVTPRTTAFAYKGRMADLRRIARELGVRHVVEASVRRDGDAVRIVATLHDVERETPLMHETYNRTFQSVLALQTELAATIAERLERRLLPADRARLAGRQPSNADAQDSYLRGRHAFEQRTASSLATALVHFKRAIQLDANYALAHAGLADTYSILAWSGFAAPDSLLREAALSARRAVEINDKIAEAHVSLAIIKMFAEWKWQEAVEEADRAIALDSTVALAWFYRTWPLAALGKLDDALESITQARRLDPLSTVNRARVGSVHFFRRDYAKADSVAREAIAMKTENPQTAQLLLARSLSLQGRHDDAIKALPADSIRLGSYEAGVAGFVYARAGNRTKALEIARALQSRPYFPPEGLATIYAGLDDTSTAVFWMDKAVESRGVGVLFLAVDPMYDNLQDDSRFQRLIEKLGLVRPSRVSRMTQQ